MAEGYINDTISIVNEDFHKAPSYRSIQINGVADECTFKLTKDSNKVKILLRPKKTISKGMYVLLEGKTYMVTNYVPNEIYPKGEIELCNNTLRWRDTLGTLKEYSCIAKGNSVKIDDEFTEKERFIITSDAELVVLVQYNSDTKTIQPNQRFIFGEYAYEVLSVDNISHVYDEKGYVQLTVKATGKTESDDTTSGVADDSSNSGWGDW